ncbi:phage tail tip lysozyme, partial [Enterococcus faecalis]
VYHKLYDIDIQTKVTGIVYDALAEKTIKITAGDIQVAFYKQQSQDFQEFIKTLTKKDYMSDFIDYVTDLINGVKGGSILKYPKNRPHTLYFMDTDSTDTAKNVIAINNQGIGFSTTGWKGPFRNAWTIDGILNADFIRAGKIRSDIFETSFNAYGDILRLVNGALQAWNGKTKIMELTRKGMGFWDGSSHVGNMGTKGNPFPLLNDANGNPVVTDGKSLLLVGNSPTNIIGLSNEESTGLIIRGATQWNLANNSYFIGKGGNKSTIYVDRLIVGGKEVIPGDGSGGNDGDVPPELTTEKEKNAWAVWQFLKSKGYSEQAAAGILGNMDQESGIMPDIDEGGGGPGYGLVQWTSPVAGESGRAYVQRLLAQAGIGGDYRNITTQLKLLDWHMHNGQYIPSAAYPYSVAEFKALTDIGTATMAFEANFERPAVTHPERIPLAQYWYDLLHNLKPGTNKWVNPVRSSYTITQEWDEIGWGTNVIHGGIDIASMPAGSMPPVYVARSGTVETVTYDGTGGNYVVIKHDDGYWTYYGHLDSVDLSVGDKVTTNSRVGIMGATGLASGVHLHFEVWKGAQWQRINPRDVINF